MTFVSCHASQVQGSYLSSGWQTPSPPPAATWCAELPRSLFTVRTLMYSPNLLALSSSFSKHSSHSSLINNAAREEGKWFSVTACWLEQQFPTSNAWSRAQITLINSFRLISWASRRRQHSHKELLCTLQDISTLQATVVTPCCITSPSHHTPSELMELWRKGHKTNGQPQHGIKKKKGKEERKQRLGGG